jgi:hypothetical protein
MFLHAGVDEVMFLHAGVDEVLTVRGCQIDHVFSCGLYISMYFLAVYTFQ